jgi:hypothetical protein
MAMLFIHVTRLEPEPEPEKRPPGGPNDGREEYEFSPQEMERMRFLRHVMGDEIAEHNAGRGLIGKPPLD